GRVQTQPTTVIQANPLTESRADKLRRQRQNLELETELKIVEQLESSRMEDEKQRAGVLFGNKFNELENRPAPTYGGNAVQAPVYGQQPQMVEPVAVDVDEATQADINAEIKSAAAELKADLD